MNQTIKPVKSKAYQVCHPEKGKILVGLDNPAKIDEDALAIMEAARLWGVNWASIASECEVEYLSEAYTVTCRCGREFPSPSPSARRCPICEKNAARERRYINRITYKDRRVNAENN